MHPYSTDSGEKKYVIFGLAVLSILGANLLIKAFPEFPFPFTAPFTIYLILFLIFDKFLWKFILFKKLHIVNIPNLTGNWEGFIKSSHDDFTQSIEAEMKIFQNWTRISVLVITDTSRSKSHIGSILLNSTEGLNLVYEYSNEPDSDSKATMHTHMGTTHLYLSEDGGKDLLKGDYYSGRSRETHGTLEFTKIK